MSNPICIFLIGGPGSGKDYVLNNIFSRFDLTEVQSDQLLNGAASQLVEQKKNIVVNGSLDSDKITVINSICEGYDFDYVYVSVTNKVSRLRNALRDQPMVETKRIDRFIKTERLVESLDNAFTFNNSINLNESSDLEKIFFANQIEKLLERLVEHGLTMQQTAEPKAFSILKKKLGEAREVEPAGQKPHLDVNSIAKKHGIDVAEIEKQLEMGRKVEHEHTKDADLATDIALNHLGEIPDYYTRLDKMEKQGKAAVKEQVLTPAQVVKKRDQESRQNQRDAWRRHRYVHHVNRDHARLAKEEKDFPPVKHDKESGLPKKYVAGLTPAEKKAKEAHIERNAKLSDRDPKAYKDMPGDKRIREKGIPLSKYTKKYHAMYGEAANPAQQAAIAIDMKKRGIKPKNEEVELDEGAADTSLAAKAKKSGISVGTLRKVYNRGVAAWNSGHRPGTTPAQWGHARVNSYITKGKTYHTADKDLHEEEQIDEMQLFGTDEYRKHAIAMTPGQSQEIEDATKTLNPFHDEQNCCPDSDIDDGQMGSGSSKGFRKLRKEAKENSVVDLTPTVNTKKIPKKVSSPQNYRSDLAGFPVTSRQTFNALESVQPTLEEAVKYHLDNNISITENVFRPGSDMFFQLIGEAKRLYREGKYTPADEYEKDLLNSDIGEKVMFEGKEVMLDFPFVQEINEEESDPTGGKGIGKPFRSGGGGAVYVRTGDGGVRKVNFSQSGMRKRINEPARVRSFVARHHCLTNKDKTSASYWACRWPRYFSNTGQQWW